MVFSNADYINANSEVIGNHNEILFEKGMVSEIAEGNIFAKLISRYFICTPTMIIRKEVFDRLGGYDESLAYEDFDFWIRSSRHWDYAYVDGVYMQKRKLETSMSAARYRFLNNEQLSSTLRVCYKAFHLCKSQEEFQALRERLNYEYRQCLRNGALDLADECLVMLGRVGGHRDIQSFLVRYTGKNFFR